MNNYKHFRAFTLIEIMVVIVIIGILLSIAVPSYREYKNATEVRSGTELVISDFQSGFSYTRSHSGAAQVIKLKKGDKNYKIETCDEDCLNRDPNTGDVTLDSTSTWNLINKDLEYSNLEILKIEGGSSETSLSEITTEMKLVFVAPFGNIDINNSEVSGAEILKITVANNSKKASFFIFLKSGFIYRINKIEAL